jgi:acyl-CoA synthetase (AMP-forming)/AMP-acid ligase II
MDRVNRLANGLRGLGLKKGDNVAILMGNYPIMVESQFALSMAGMVYIRTNPRLSAKEYLRILNDSKARGILVGNEFGDIMAEVATELQHAEFIIYDGSGAKGWINYEEIVDQSPNDDQCVKISSEDYNSLRYSSGTTGHPKGILHTERSRMASLINVLVDTPISDEDVMLHVSSLSHGSSLYFLECFVQGAKSIILNSFDPESFFHTIEKERVTKTYLVPTMISMLLDADRHDQYDLSSLDCAIYAGSPLAPQKLREAIGVFGNIFHQVYGLGEAPNVITSLNKKDHLAFMERAEKKEQLSAGRASLLSLVKIVDEARRELGPGEVGEIVIKSDQLMKGYWNLPQKTEESFHEGWFYTGDIGMKDELDYLYVVERKKDMIISGGFNVYPAEVERAICSHPAVSEVAVVGIPDEKWGEVIKAFVVIKRGIKVSEEEIINVCKENIASFKKPRSVEFVDSLPKTATGKILKKELKLKSDKK